MHTDRTSDFIANIDYSKVLADANAERAKMLRLMFREAKAFVANLFSGHGAAATQN